MKKILTIALAVGFGVVTSAQSNDQIQNKKGKDLLPVKGEYAIGLGTTFQTMTNYVGNIFNNSANNTIGNTYIQNPVLGTGSIFGKYMISDNQAIRATFYNSGYDETEVFEVYDDRSNDPDSVVYDKLRENFSETAISLGLEWRRGKSRLRGVYGADAVVFWNNSHQHYNYGNQLGLSNATPTDSPLMPAYDFNHGRVIEQRNGASFGIGARGFAGVEYFIAPKICIGTEFGWSIRFNKSADTKTTYEKFDPFYDNGTGGIVTYTDETNQGGWGINSGLDNFSNQIYFHFYF